jgi:hypothetical protein
MSNRDRNDRNQNRNRNRDRNSPRVNAKGEQMELIFGEMQIAGERRMVSMLADGTYVYPDSLRFRPMSTVDGRPSGEPKRYVCSVRFKETRKGKIGLARPTLPHTLTPREWVPFEELQSVLLVPLVFELRGKPGGDGEKRLIAFYNGRAVFPNTGTTVAAGQRTLCMLREAGNVAFAVPVSIEQTKGKGLMKLAEALGEASIADLAYVVLKTAKAKPGVGRPKEEKDVEIAADSYRSVYELLSDPDRGVVVNESSTEDEIAKAYKGKVRSVHPDTVCSAWGGQDKAPVIVRKNAQLFFEAIESAKSRALEIIESRKDKKAEKDGAQAAAPTAEAPKADAKEKGKRPRKERKPSAKQTETVAEAPKAEAEVPVETAAEVVEEKPVEASQEPETPATEPVAASEAAPEIESETVSDEEKDPEQLEIEEAHRLCAKNPQYAGISFEEFLGKPDSIIKFFRKQARVNLKRNQAASGSKGKGGSSGAKASAGSSGGDFKSQLAGIRRDMKA